MTSNVTNQLQSASESESDFMALHKCTFLTYLQIAADGVKHMVSLTSD